MIEKMEKLFCEETLYESWDSLAEKEKSKHNGGLQNREGSQSSHRDVFLVIWPSVYCKLLFTTSYNAGARGVME